MALRRHLSQERLTTPHSSGQDHPPGPSTSAAETKQHHSHHHSHHQSRSESSRIMSTASVNAGSGGNSSSSNSSSGAGGNGGILGTRTIGDLVSGEIERTLEISNQSLINAAVDMSVISGGRPDNVYSPISRPASAEGETGLATLAHVASYAPTPSAPATPTPSTATTRSSVLYPPQQSLPQR